VTELNDPGVMPEDTAPSKPGWKTTEFWLSLVAVVVAFVQSQSLFSENSTWAEGLAVLATILASLGYTASRTIIKQERIKAQRELSLLHFRSRYGLREEEHA